MEGFRAIQRGSWDSMLAHVGSGWGYVGSRRPQVGTKMAQDRFMLAQVGPKTPKMAPRARGQRPGGWGVASLNIYIYIYIYIIIYIYIYILFFLNF